MYTLAMEVGNSGPVMMRIIFPHLITPSFSPAFSSSKLPLPLELNNRILRWRSCLEDSILNVLIIQTEIFCQLSDAQNPRQDPPIASMGCGDGFTKEQGADIRPFVK